ncbi:MAG: MMPL family transporter [Burkholderiaceae bacterium]|nr:MMPL family transporter [Burkholderiaceae bacterium]
MPTMPERFEVVSSLDRFDRSSGNRLERLLFNHRVLVVGACVVLTLVLGLAATQLRLNASFLKTIPTGHPFIVNYLANESDLKGLANALRIAVEAPEGRDIFDAGYLEILRRINDEVYLIPGVDRAYVKSLWMPATRWTGITENGFDGGPVIADGYDGSAQSLRTVRANVERSGEIGQLVAPDMRSSIVYVPLIDVNPQTGETLDYKALSTALEAIRAKYEAEGVRVHITGFAKIMGDLIEGLEAMLGFFAAAVLITGVLLFRFTRCLRSTLLVQVCTLVGVTWLLGLLPLLGHELNPYSILVPFLVYAIGVSHGAQKMNGIMQDIGRGTHRLVAARYTFRRLFTAGATALFADMAGFAVLLLIDIPVIRDLALIASIGVGILIFTNLALLPVLLSYTGVSPVAARRSLQNEADGAPSEYASAHGVHQWIAHPFWRVLVSFTTPSRARAAIACAAVLAAAAFAVSTQLRIGDLDRGAPELRADSRYNRDNDFVVRNYQASSDTFAIMVKTPLDTCARYETLRKVDELEWMLRQVRGVEGTHSVAALARLMSVGMNEGSLKWGELVPNQHAINLAASRAPRELLNPTCDVLVVYAYLQDHKADTLAGVVAAVQAFAAANDDEHARFLLAAGNAGIESATNIVVKEANIRMLVGVYVMVTLLCLIAFRSWRAVLCAVLPLALTSVMAEALMVALGMGVKVATLPVIALGVGIGVDYALYVLSVTMSWLKQGATLAQAYYRALLFTGRVVVFTGVTLSLGVLTWVLSPIKFQADMGILLTFMFLWNMLGALILIPALACYLVRPVATVWVTPAPA